MRIIMFILTLLGFINLFVDNMKFFDDKKVNK